jgi:hypothetical protein
MRVSEGDVINIHTMRRSDEEGRRKGGGRAGEGQNVVEGGGGVDVTHH